MIYRYKVLRSICLLSLLAIVSSCARPIDYSRYRHNLPRSVLVIPPLNNTVEVNASYSYLITVSRPLAEMGYYVFPVAVVDSFMKDNGLPTPDEMNSVSLAKLKEVFNPDAVLYLTIEEWGQKYLVISSNTVVRVSARLVDVDSGETLWLGSAEAVESSGGRNHGLIEMAVAAAVEQIVDSSTSRVMEVAERANQSMIYSESSGWLRGPYHPQFAEDLRGR